MDGRKVKHINQHWNKRKAYLQAILSRQNRDEIPKYNAEKTYTEIFSGQRIKRGLYQSKSGQLINADVNGAANILRKSKQNFDFEELCVGLLASPLRIRVA